MCEATNAHGEYAGIFAPVTVSYHQDGNLGWQKVTRDYYDGVEDARHEEPFRQHVLFDPVSEVSFLGVATHPNVEVLRASESFDRAWQSGEKRIHALRGLVEAFPGVKFGVFGSRSVGFGIAWPISDIDLVVYGASEYNAVTKALAADQDLREEMGLREQEPEKIESDINHYVRKFGLNASEARVLALRRSRFLLPDKIKLSINGAIDDIQGEAEIPRTIGSKQIEEIVTTARVIDARYSAMLPRCVRVAVGRDELNVVTGKWSLKDFVNEGELVELTGTLRESQNGEAFVSLEKPDHIIKPVIRGTGVKC